MQSRIDPVRRFRGIVFPPAVCATKPELERRIRQFF
jgi:hypothetical protein